ncbi:MAG: box helicase domain protein [Pseudonocardiales bacterium]|nr:box helicase domain protein [Pseudonocardiales bacterium]
MWDDLPVRIVPTEDLPSFRELGLPSAVVSALSRNGIESPFPIQAATIPDVLAGRDLLGRAATGSGKTLAFGLPLIARLEGSPANPRRPRGLVLVPTRELAMQVTDAIAPLAQARSVSVRLVAGGLPIQKQIQSLERGVDVLVATPGRLIDLIERRSCDLREVEVTVLDEADHMADLGFLPVVRRLLDMTPARGQRLLFSATLDGDVATLVESYLTDPAVHALHSAEASVDTMSHHLFRVPFEAKFDLVASIAAREGRTLCFVRTKHGAERMARNLSRAGIAAGALHGGRTQAQRNRALAAFRDGSVPVLVATDVAARGIHVDDVSLVLHVDPPQDGKDYLHRSGRTARAGESGTVVLLTTPAEERAVRKVLAEAGVHPEQRDAVAGDTGVAAVTGARRPSGVAVVEKPQKAPKAPRVEHGARPERTRQNGPRGARRRPGAGTATSTRHPQAAERRPRRARTH